MKSNFKIAIAIISLVIILLCGIWLFRLIEGKTPKIDPIAEEIKEIRQEVVKERIIIKEVVRDEKQKAVERVYALSDDAVCAEWNERIRRHKNRSDRNGS